VVTLLDKGARVEEIQTRGHWLNVRLPDGQSGWIFRNVLQPAASPFSQQPGVLQNVGHHWLLAIDINEYAHWPKLNTASNDAREVARTMTRDYGFDPDRVITLYDQEATIDNILSAFVKLKAQVKAEDSVMVYYAGHGLLDDFDAGSWVPVNAREQKIGDYITTDRINRMIATLVAKHVFLVADACYSGALFTSRGRQVSNEINESYFLDRVKRASRQALTSGGIEEVQDDGREGHSVFAYHFL
jgi:hypothetical protein